MKSIYFSLVFSLVCQCLFAQHYPLQVFGSKGNNTVNGVPLKVGTKLKENELVVVEGSYLGLLHTEQGKSVEITTKGSYAVKDLVTQTLQNKESSLKTKYMNFIISEMTKDNKEDVPRSRYMNKTGAVERDFDDNSRILFNLSVNHKPIDIYGNEIGIGWLLTKELESKNNGKVKHYALLVLDLSEQIFHTVVFTGASQDVLLTIPNQAFAEAGSDLILRVVPIFRDLKPNEQPTTDELLAAKDFASLTIEELGMQRSQKIAQDLKELGNHTDEEINLLLQAEYFKDKKLFLNAMAVYLVLQQKAPDNILYKKLYENCFFANKEK